MVSVNPLSDPNQAVCDERIEGIWKSISEKNEKVYLHIGRSSKNKMIAIMVEHKKNGELESKKIPFFCTRTSKNNYLNLKVEDIFEKYSEKEEEYIFLKYVLPDKDNLIIFHLERQPIIMGIQSNKLKGEITY